MYRQNFRRFSGGGRRQPKKIDPRFFVQKASLQEVEVAFVPKNSFADFAIDARLKQNILGRGYETPTPIQDQAIPELLNGRDVVGIASTGTGKTAAFLIPLINKVLQDDSQNILIIVPTRELAVQIDNELKLFTRDMRIYSVICIGGVSIRPQIQALYRNPHFVIGTPGRLQDLEAQGKLRFGSFQTIVLDEVDRMLDMGFVNEMKYIISKLSMPRQSLFFSATLPDKVLTIMKTFLNDPITISVKASKPSVNVDQDIVQLRGEPKVEVLHKLLIQKEFTKVLIFGRTKWGMEKLSRELSYRGFRSAAIHGNKSQGQRQRAIEDFKNSRVQILVATDVASRGLDIENVTHVINYDQPESYEDYIHRIGRTGRANKKGIALTFID